LHMPYAAIQNHNKKKRRRLFTQKRPQAVDATPSRCASFLIIARVSLQLPHAVYRWCGSSISDGGIHANPCLRTFEV